MEISAKVVMELRGRTGAGMMDCKKALAECGGDMDKAIDFLREKGLAAAAKKQSRIAAEGLVDSYLCDCMKAGALMEINCETDFVAKTDEFKALIQSAAKAASKAYKTDKAIDATSILDVKMDSGETVGAEITEKVAKIGEKITVRRLVCYELEGNGIVESYIHMGGKVGVLVEVKCGAEATEKSDLFKELVHDIALQIAASAPEYIRRAEVKADHLEHEKEILAAQARNEGKPEKIIEKMVEGRVSKFYKEVCLLEQPFVKNPDQTIEQLIQEKAKALGDGIEVTRFARYKMGDGLEKRVNDLAAEVAEQTAAMQK